MKRVQTQPTTIWTMVENHWGNNTPIKAYNIAKGFKGHDVRSNNKEDTNATFCSFKTVKISRSGPKRGKTNVILKTKDEDNK